VTGHAAFFKTDGLAAFRAGLSQKAVFRFAVLYAGITPHISLLKNPADGIGYGQHKPSLLKNRVLATNPFELFNNLFSSYPGPEAKRRKTADGLCLGRSRSAAFANGRKDLKGASVIFSNRHIKSAQTGNHLGGKAFQSLWTFFHRPHKSIRGVFFRVRE